MILQGKADDPGDIPGADAFGDIAAVLFHSPFGEVDLAAYLPGRLLLADEADDLYLLGGEAGVGDDQPGMFFFGEHAGDDMIAGFPAEIFFSFQQGAHCPDELFVILAFDDISMDACSEHLEDGGGVAVEGIGEDASGGERVSFFPLLVVIPSLLSVLHYTV